MVVCLREYQDQVAASRPARMRWWKEARFGMFVHWGLYSQIGRNEWVHAIEAIPMGEYEKLATTFKPMPQPAREWARLAKAAGMKYMVLTTKHHEGFCLWNTQQTNFNSVKYCGRDLVAEYVEACREFGLRCGLYYSLMDWHHPDGAACAYDPAARRRFLDFTQGCVRELLSNYGRIDILWYDVSVPMKSHEGWESLPMNQMARRLQPEILINDRGYLPEDFGTPEGHVTPAEGKEWEACMTFNDTSWGWMPSAAVDAHTPRSILKMLASACRGSGNLLLNIGPSPEGNVPEESVGPLTTVGQWLARNGEAVYGKLDRTFEHWQATAAGTFSRRGNTLYYWLRYWPEGGSLGLGGFETKLKSARFVATGKKIDFAQKDGRIVLQKLPASSRDRIVDITLIALEFAGEPVHRGFPQTPALRANQPGKQ